MSNLLQAAIPVMIPAAVAVLVAYQGAISRTGRLRRNVKADVEVLAALPADHPSREGLEGHVGELVDELIRREQLHYFPVGRLGWGFVMVVAVTLAIAGAAVILALAATGTVVVRGVPPKVARWSVVVYVAAAIFAGWVAVRAWQRSRRPRAAAERSAAAL